MSQFVSNYNSGQMEGFFQNISVNLTAVKSDHCGVDLSVFLSLTDIFTVLFGQPIIAALLWICLTSRKTPDVLNCNLAVFHNVLYWMCFLHFLTHNFKLEMQAALLKFIVMYAQIGSPMSLMFICVQRYVAVVYPTSYTLLKKYRYSEVCSASVWILTVPAAYFLAFASTVHPSIANDVLTSAPCALMLLMIAMMVRSSICIVRTLKNPAAGGEKLHPAKRKAFVAMRAMFSIAIFFYLPVVVIQKSTDDEDQVYDCLATPVCLFLLSVASVVHPLFYLFTQGKWRKKTRRAEKTQSQKSQTNLPGNQ
ncbi:P2Y purinoceptor 1-like [Cynoglossus semilaevis]|uniref:P2Y purinoceptor 1-like n=1 Tax=Cynoglossus semilaevis TaxID=244447 RepID=UPI0007DC9C9F|nr:P2Y purinoceptor 1-like [Cynoglossus semilaevis]